MTTLTRFLSDFNSGAIQRSSSYVSRIDRRSLDIFKQGKDNVYLFAVVKGTYSYDTNIIYDLTDDRIIDTSCSCPVAYDCKHAVALARLFYNEYRDSYLREYNNKLLSGMQKNAILNYQEVENWLSEFKKYLEKTTQKPIVSTNNHIIYYLDQIENMSKLTVEVIKGRLNKNGTLGSISKYTDYPNIISQRLALSEEQRVLFSMLYQHSQMLFNINSYFYQSYLNITGLSFESFKTFIQSGDVYWKLKSDAPLNWSDQEYHLDMSWQKNAEMNTEKLDLSFISGSHRFHLGEYPNLLILAVEPLCYIDIDKNQVGRLNSQYPIELLNHFQQMPEIPVTFLDEFEQLIQKSAVTAKLPKPKSVQEMKVIKGDPQPVLRFGALPNILDQPNFADNPVAEIEFVYPAGIVKLGASNESFVVEFDGSLVRQQRNFVQEQQAIQRLEMLMPSLKWLKDIVKKPDPRVSSKILASFASAKISDWIQQLMPTNQFEIMGWTVEHTEESPFNFQYVNHVNVSLNDAEGQQDWFEVGATVQDSDGNQYDLLEALSTMMRMYPLMFFPSMFDHLDDNKIFIVPTEVGKPDLAISVKDIRPIVSNLYGILQQGERGIDRYDAHQLVELEHRLGMQWQISNRLQSFVDKFKQEYQQQLPTPVGFQGELRPYQQQGLGWLQFLRATEHGGILADDMGLGKTAQTLAHLLMEKQAGYLEGKPALIVAPTSLMHNWYKEAEKFTPDLKVLVLQGQKRHALFEEILQSDVILTTYPLLARDEEKLNQYEYHQLILDEAQNIKNPQAKAAQVVRQLKADHRLCLTGTPMENHLGELWSLFYFLMPGFLYSQEIFNKKYRYPIEKNAEMHLKEKLVGRIKPFILRRLKTEVAKELPEKTTIEVNIDMNSQQSKLYEAVRATMQKTIRELVKEKGFNRSQIHILDALLKLRQVCCDPRLLKLDNVKTENIHSAKLEHLMEMIVPMVEEGRKILIFSQFTAMLTLIEEQLKNASINYVKLTGQTKKREEVITKFQEGNAPIFLISLKAGGVGLNLTAADTVIHYDPWWNPAVEDQASDRAWRIGQDKPVFVYKLVTNQSIEEKIIDLQKNKAALAQSILSTDNEGEVKLTENDMMKLFEKF